MIDKRYAKKRFGQNYLNDKNVLKKISSIISTKNKSILEIGPGKGALTDYLIADAKHVIAYEIDNNLFSYLSEKYKNNENIKIINQDFLKADLNQFDNFIIISNIPYNISTDILFKIFENYKKFDEVILLVQKDFAQRLVAKKNTKNYSKISPTTKLFYNASICFDVDPSAFFPKPKVISSVVHLKATRQNFDINYNEIMEFIKRCFAMRRKTLWNNIKNLNIINYDIFVDICNKLNINEKIRPENLELEEFIEIWKLIKENHKS